MITRNYFKVVRVFPDPSDYFYIKNEGYEDMSIWLDLNSEVHPTIQVKIDNGTWANASQIGGQVLHPNSKFYVRGADGFWKDSNGENGIGIMYDSSSPMSVGGDIRTLLNYTDVDSVTTIPANCFNSIFNNQQLFIDASNLSFAGITSVGDYGMKYMFFSCSQLASAPDLSSITSVGLEGMNYMFGNCSSLSTAPDLSSLTSVGDYGLAYMFMDSSSLTTGSDLRHLTSVGDYGLAQCYFNCGSLTSAYAPNVSTWENTKTNAWLGNVASTGVLYKPANLTIPTGSSGVPDDWTTQTYPNA